MNYNLMHNHKNADMPDQGVCLFGVLSDLK